MTAFQIIAARPYHCGAMVRRLRTEHTSAVAHTGMDAHRELRSVFDASAFRRALLIDGHLAALGGVTGGLMAATGFAWFVLTDQATRYPHRMVRIAKRQLAEVMTIKRELATTVIGGDSAALRFAIYLGFHVADHGRGAAAHSRFARRDLKRFVEAAPEFRLPVGGGYCIAMGYHDEININAEAA